MLKEVGASGQISLGKKYAGQLFEVQQAPDGTITLMPVKVVPAPHTVQKKTATYQAGTASKGDGWLTPERLTRRAAAAARSPAEVDAARTLWEAENKDAIEAFNTRMRKIGSMGQRIHAWRKERDAAEVAQTVNTPAKPTKPIAH